MLYSNDIYNHMLLFVLFKNKHLFRSEATLYFTLSASQLVRQSVMEWEKSIACY